MTTSNTVVEEETVPEKGHRHVVRFHLDTGAVIEFKAAKATTTVGTLQGDLRGYSIEDAVGDVPLWLDISRVVAVTRDVEDDES